MPINYTQRQGLKHLGAFISGSLMLWYFFLLSNDKITAPKIPNVFHYIKNTRQCLDSAFLSLSEQKYDTTWLNAFKKTWLELDKKLNPCAKEFYKLLQVKEIRNHDEIKLVILPNAIDSESHVLTLGIGKDVSAEEQLQKELKKSTFFGVDPDAEISGKLYQNNLNGKFVQGLVGAQNGSYEASVLDSNDKYETQTLPHFSLEYLIKKHYNREMIDYLLMDIEGDEFALMEELIYNHQKYPTICQINVEYHNPYKITRGDKFFESFYVTITKGPYLPIITKSLPDICFNRMFLFGLAQECIDKYL